MNYFAYGSNLNARQVAEWCRHHGLKPPQLRDPRAAVLENYRLGFPVYSEYWGGGIADIVYDPGKTAMGVIWDVGERDLATLERKLDDRVGGVRRLDVEVTPVAGGAAVKAVAFTHDDNQGTDVPPTQTYLDGLIEGAYEAGLSMMWISYLQSFDTQPARRPGIAAR